jgi:predicted AlkP superfamily phosphohydrolase/phosphomutase
VELKNMKILVIGLDCAAPRFLFGEERLTNFRRLMVRGRFGQLESVIPPITVPAWMCMATGQDPGQLGVYGFRNRLDYSYTKLGVANSRSFDQPALWDILGRQGRKVILVGIPPSYPPRKVNGISVGCFLTPNPQKDIFTFPPRLSDEILAWAQDYAVDVREFRTDRKEWLQSEIFSMSRRHFEVIRRLMTEKEWDYFQFVEIGLDRIHHGFWQYSDPTHPLYQAGNPFENTIRDYYQYLDEEIGQLLELIDEETAVLVVSDHGAKALQGGFCINEWLVRQELLALKEYPLKVTPFDQLPVEWSRTTAWSEGGYYARLFLNVKGREPQGTIEPADYEKVRNEIKTRLELLPDDQGKAMGTRVFKPEETYHQVRGIAPDLIVYLGNLAWRSIGGVGYPSLYTPENDTGPDACNHAPSGCFILTAPGVSAGEEIKGASLLQFAPSILRLLGMEIPEVMRSNPWEWIQPS